jgi:hypothetical protein
MGSLLIFQQYMSSVEWVFPRPSLLDAFKETETMLICFICFFDHSPNGQH